MAFALGYTSLQVVRNAFVVWATDRDSQLHGAFLRISAWSVVVGAAVDRRRAGRRRRPRGDLGGGAGDRLRRARRPATGCRGIGRTPAEQWQIEGSHFAERFQLFVIIALGESIVVTGATASASHIDAWAAVAIAVSFLGSAALWWLYFDYVASIAQRRLASSDDTRCARPRRLHLRARGADRRHHRGGGGRRDRDRAADRDAVGGRSWRPSPAGPRSTWPATCCSGCAWPARGARKRLAALVAVLAAGVAGLALPALATATLVLAVLVALIVCGDAGRRRGGAGAASPTPLERLEARLSDEPAG